MSGDLQARPGRLKIFLGAAPGVGKTHAMLHAAHRCRRGGLDAVIGLIETHGRRELDDLVQGMEQVDRRQIEYRGNRFEEIDVSAIVKRHPGLALVDELAHSNVSGSKNPKRYLDVEEILAAGIDVWTTLNVQHVESLREAAAKITWVEASETVPDRVLELAEEIEVVDFSPAEVLRRFEEGRLDGLAHSRLSGRSFFTAGNLVALRELTQPLAKRRPARQLLVPFDGSPAAIRAVQHVGALARAGHRASVLLLNVQQSAAASEESSSSRAQRAGAAILESAARALAAQHIACFCRVVTGKPADRIADVVRQDRVDLIVMGSTGTGRVADILFGSVARRVAEQSEVPVTLVR